jgi:hypothetical protein
MPPRNITTPDMALWSQCIGGLIINFGGIEFQTLRWIELLGSEEAAINARRKKLSQRIAAVTSLLESSPLSDAAKSRARELWTEVRELAQMRNRVAHNPIGVGRAEGTGELTLSVIDLQQMTPTGQNALERLHYTQIESAALRARDISNELRGIIERRT